MPGCSDLAVLHILCVCVGGGWGGASRSALLWSHNLLSAAPEYEAVLWYGIQICTSMES